MRSPTPRASAHLRLRRSAAAVAFTGPRAGPLHIDRAALRRACDAVTPPERTFGAESALASSRDAAAASASRISTHLMRIASASRTALGKFQDFVFRVIMPREARLKIPRLLVQTAVHKNRTL